MYLQSTLLFRSGGKCCLHSPQRVVKTSLRFMGDTLEWCVVPRSANHIHVLHCRMRKAWARIYRSLDNLPLLVETKIGAVSALALRALVMMTITVITIMYHASVRLRSILLRCWHVCPQDIASQFPQMRWCTHPEECAPRHR